MRTWRALLLRLAGVFSKDRRESEISAELESHLQMQIEDNVRAGMTPEEGRRAALVKLGGLEQTKQAYRERGTMPLVESAGQDLRFGLRQFIKNPAFACTAVLVLGLGIGASVAIFAFVDATLLKPLPYWKPARLANVTETVAMIPRADLSYPDYLDWKSRNDVFSSLDVWNQRGYMLSTPDGVQLVMGTRVSDGFFRTLGVDPIRGAPFTTVKTCPMRLVLSCSAIQDGRSGSAGGRMCLENR